MIIALYFRQQIGEQKFIDHTSAWSAQLIFIVTSSSAISILRHDSERKPYEFAFNPSSFPSLLSRRVFWRASAYKKYALEILAPDSSNSPHPSGMRVLEAEAARGEDYFANSRNRGFVELAIIVVRTAISRAATPINSSDNSPSSPPSSKLAAV